MLEFQYLHCDRNNSWWIKFPPYLIRFGNIECWHLKIFSRLMKDASLGHIKLFKSINGKFNEIERSNIGIYDICHHLMISLGTGQFGTVSKITWKGQVVALKSQFIREEEKHLQLREVSYLRWSSLFFTRLLVQCVEQSSYCSLLGSGDRQECDPLHDAVLPW